MKKFFRKDSFVDFKGIERPFTLCGAIHNNVEGFSVITDKDSSIPDHYREFDGIFSVGLSICHEQDLENQNPLIGLAQAEGRAMKIKNCALVLPLSNKNIFTITMANQVLDSIVEDIKRVPGKYIPGYNQMEEAYLKKQKGLKCSAEANV